MKGFGIWVARGFTLLVLAGIVGWSALAIYYSNLPWPLARLVVSGAFVVLSLAVLAAVRPLRRGAVVVLSGPEQGIEHARVTLLAPTVKMGVDLIAELKPPFMFGLGLNLPSGPFSLHDAAPLAFLENVHQLVAVFVGKRRYERGGMLSVSGKRGGYLGQVGHIHGS